MAGKPRERVFDRIFDVSGNKGYKKFLVFLILIDLTWFATVAFDNLLGLQLQDYGDFLWITFFACGMIVVSNLKKIGTIGTKGIKSDSFSSMVTLLVGIMALVVAILSLPQIGLESPVMNAIKGIIAVIAIAYVVIEALIAKD